MELSSQQVMAEVTSFKVKEGYLFKKFGNVFSSEWRERWLVLTDNYLMSFEHKQTYTKGCELIPVQDIQTLKSYFKKQQDRDLSFRAETKEKNFYLAARTNQDKWAWIGAIERTIDKKLTRIFNPKDKTEPQTDVVTSQPNIPQLAEAVKLVRKGLEVKQINESPNQKAHQDKQKVTVVKEEVSEGKEKIVEDNQKVTGDKQTSPDDQTPPLESGMAVFLKTDQKQPPSTPTHLPATPSSSTSQQDTLKTSTYVSNQRDTPSIDYSSYDSIISRLFTDILKIQRNMTFFVNFITALALQHLLPYTSSIIEACISHPNARFFIQSLVKAFSLETDESLLNAQLIFMILLHEYHEGYFYLSDLKVLVDNLIRNLEMYKSQANHGHILQLIQSLITTTNWDKVDKSQKKELHDLIAEVNKTSPSLTNRQLSQQILPCI